MIANNSYKHKILAAVLVAISTLLLITWAQTPRPPLENAAPGREIDSSKRDLARLYRIMGISARDYEFSLEPSESLVLKFHATTNGVDDKSDTFAHKVTFPVYQEFDKNYPTFEPLRRGRLIDVEILQPGHTWNPEKVKVSVRVPGFERYFHFVKPKSSSTGFSDNPRITRAEKNRLLELNYSYSNGDVRTLTVDAIIESSSSPR